MANKLLEQAQKSFRTIMNELEALSAKEKLTDEEKKSVEDKKEAAKGFKKEMETQMEIEALKTWRSEPDGQSATSFGWSGEAVDENEDGTPAGEKQGIVSDKAGYLYDVSMIGAKTLKIMKSGAYKDAFVAHLRSAFNHQPMKASHMKVLQEGMDTSGGFWVPPDLRPEVVKKMATITGVKDDVYEFTTGSDVVSFPAVTYTADNQYTSGVRFTWTAEAPASNISEATNPVAGRVNIPVHTALASIVLTRSIVEDNQFDILGYISMLMGESYGLGKDDAYINGSGLGQPQGILSHTNATVAHVFATDGVGMYVPSGVSARVTWLGTTLGTPEPEEGFTGVEQALSPQYENNAKWYGHKNMWAQAGSLTDTTARPLWLKDNQFSNYINGVRVPPNLLGYPVVKDNMVPIPAASSYSVIFGDMGGYYAPQRTGMSIEVARELLIQKDEILVVARQRFGGQLVHDWRVRLMKLATS